MVRFAGLVICAKGFVSRHFPRGIPYKPCCNTSLAGAGILQPSFFGF